MSRSLKAHLLLVLTTLVWGASFVVIKNALRDITPLLFNALRMSVATVTLLAVFWRDLRGMGSSLKSLGERLRAGALARLPAACPRHRSSS